MKKSAVLVLVALLVGSNVAEAVSIRGARSCGQWISYRAAKSWEALVVENWLVGYLSGLANAAPGDNTNFWGRPSIDLLDIGSAYLWVDNYCRANPLKRLDDAGDALFRDRCDNPGSCPN